MEAMYCDTTQMFISACCYWFQYCENGVSFRFVNKEGHEDFFVIKDVELADFLTYPLDDYSETAFRKVLSFLMPHAHVVGDSVSFYLDREHDVVISLSYSLYLSFIDFLKTPH